MPTLTPTILIVDDNPAGLDVIESFLAKSNYSLEFASNGSEAINKAKELVPDLILLDVMMPDIDGFAVCSNLRSHSVLAEVPIIMITAFEERSLQLKGLEAGADDFLYRPVNKEELRAKVKTITRLNRYRHLLTERERFQWVIDQTNNGYLILDQNNDILYSNPRADFFLGGNERESIEGEDFIEISSKEYLLKPQSLWESWPGNLPKTSTPPLYLVRPETENSREFWLSVETMETNSGFPNERMLCLKDVTENIDNQQNLKIFHNLISHKFGSPLHQMEMGIELLTSSLDDDNTSNDNSQEELHKVIIDAAHQIKDQIGNILDYLNVPNTLLSQKSIQVYDLNPIISDIATEISIEDITFHYPPQLEQALVSISEEAFKKLCVEILGNSKKFHPNNSPSIDISISLEIPNMITLKIIDDGIHLSPEQLEKVFEPYYQAERWFTGETKGMGLGLSTSAAIIWGAGGECFIQNRTDADGVMIMLNLPFILPTEEVSENTILYIEDDFNNMRMVKKLLKPNGYNLLWGVSGEQGIDLAKRYKPDVILLDINLIGMNGIEVARHLRSSEIPHLMYVPIIAITGEDDEKVVKQILEAGCDVYMRKPINLRELNARIEGFISQEADNH